MIFAITIMTENAGDANELNTALPTIHSYETEEEFQYHKDIIDVADDGNAYNLVKLTGY